MQMCQEELIAHIKHQINQEDGNRFEEGLAAVLGTAEEVNPHVFEAGMLGFAERILSKPTAKDEVERVLNRVCKDAEEKFTVKNEINNFGRIAKNAVDELYNKVSPPTSKKSKSPSGGKS